MEIYIYVLYDFKRGNHILWTFVVQIRIKRSGVVIVVFGLLLAASACIWEGQRIRVWDNWERTM